MPRILFVLCMLYCKTMFEKMLNLFLGLHYNVIPKNKTRNIR